MTNLEFPAINAETLPGQMEQVRRYLYQFAERLNIALSAIEKGGASGGLRIERSQDGKIEVEQISTFDDLKALIISSADVVQSFASGIKRIYDGSGAYVAQSDFGKYQEKRRTLLDVDEENGVTLLMTEEQRIVDAGTENERSYRGCIRLGKVTEEGEDGEAYGMSVGQIVEKNGQRTYETSARYRSDGVDFYDRDGNRVAYVQTNALGESRFFIERAEVTELIVGEFDFDASDGLAIVWKE